MHTQLRLLVRYETLVLLCVLCFIGFSCEPDSFAESENIEVTYGTKCFCQPFGETTTIFNPSLIIKTKISNTQDVEDLSCQKSIAGGDWNMVLQNLNIEEFVNIPETVGCPNCADEGAQWLQITTQHTGHKVTWSNNEELKQMRVLLEIIENLITKHFKNTECQ